MQPAYQTSGDAGRNLADQLSALSLHDPVIVVLSPQAVGFAFEAAQRLGCELDLLLIGYIQAPGHPEQVIGSVLDLDGPRMIVDEDLAREFHVPPGYLNTERQHQIAELERLHLMYIGDDDASGHVHSGKDVVLLDDGTDAAILNVILKRLGETGARSIRIVEARPADERPMEDRMVAHLLKEARRIHRRLH